jgi:carboxylate-amine ligase
MTDPAFTVGLEEEYLLVDRKTRDLVREPPPSVLAECERRIQGQVSPEFLRSQIEVQTRPHARVADARADLAHLRRTVIENGPSRRRRGASATRRWSAICAV